MYKEKTFMDIRKLDHVSFLVKDVEHSRRFYGQVLGLREIPRPSNASNSGAWLTNDEHSFEVHLIGEAEEGRVAQTHTQYRRDEMASGQGSHPAFEVENLEATMQHLDALNVEIVGGPRPRGDGVQQVFICDPDGYMIELFVREAR
jgi:catechol 2,3-dioxygenase-like lactoylglutathione lyase family enzyme